MPYLYYIDKNHFDAVIFDLDGVLIHSQILHARAWKELFDPFLQKQQQDQGRACEPFDIEKDYTRFVDGKPRYEGVRSFLASRAITLAFGSQEDSPEEQTVCGLGNKKNRLFQALLKSEGVVVYQSSIDLLYKLKSKGFKVAVASSSKNCQAMLYSAGIEKLFDEQVDGKIIQEHGLKGKPNPDMFLYVAKKLGVAPEKTVVIEDALSGVEAGHRGNFGFVIGVDRARQEDALKAHGADVVVSDLAQIGLA